MDTDVYLKKVYTVAFRLTGDKKAACELAVHAVIKSAGGSGMSNNIHIFNWPKDKTSEIQRAILNLNPINRTIIIWKDILGFQLSDLLPVTNTGKNELNAGLSHARMQIKQNAGRNILF
ncbi:MAG: hypothetical protein WBJ13_04690 [Sedimentibacter sp.]